GLSDLDDVDDDVAVGQLGDGLAQLLDVGALLADHDAGTRRMDCHPALLVRTLDHDLGHRGLLERGHELLADLHVLVQQRAVLVLAGVPARIPSPVDTEPQSDRIDLLTHKSTSVPLLKPLRSEPDARRWSGSKTASKSCPCGHGRAGGSA